MLEILIAVIMLVLVGIGIIRHRRVMNHKTPFINPHRQSRR